MSVALLDDWGRVRCGTRCLADEQVALMRFVSTQRERKVVLDWPGRAFAVTEPFLGKGGLMLAVDPAVGALGLKDDPMDTMAPPRRSRVLMVPHELHWAGAPVYVYALVESDMKRIERAVMEVFRDFNWWADRPWWGAAVVSVLTTVRG